MAAYRRVYDSRHLQNRDQLRNPTLGNRVWATFTFFTIPTQLRLGLRYTLYGDVLTKSEPGEENQQQCSRR